MRVRCFRFLLRHLRACLLLLPVGQLRHARLPPAFVPVYAVCCWCDVRAVLTLLDLRYPRWFTTTAFHYYTLSYRTFLRVDVGYLPLPPPRLPADGKIRFDHRILPPYVLFISAAVALPSIPIPPSPTTYLLYRILPAVLYPPPPYRIKTRFTATTTALFTRTAGLLAGKERGGGVPATVLVGLCHHRRSHCLHWFYRSA